jgi:tetratricopeptide (TPR) repeat protein
MPLLRCPGCIERAVRSMKTDRRTCPTCGNEFSGAMAFCPVCMLRMGLGGGAESNPPFDEDTAVFTSEHVAQRFEHYELAKNEDGRPVELGRGAMGVTYKAFDVDLGCPVTLKIISERNLENESTRLRFLREARAAASVRHPNVASVFHLGRSEGNYFYTMEFVDGQTLEEFIKRSGRLEVLSALEITAQVAAGLTAVHRQKLVHRDIKPSNIMVSLEDGGAVTAKIIDLGLAKPAHEAPADAAISTPGAFVGTPQFASPEQFAGAGVDIRSDLYSLGVSLWQMLTGNVPFRGSPAEMMYQHQHTPLPLEQLEGAPQPVVALIEVLLEKDPRRRFQTPAGLLKAIQAITGAVETGYTITAQSLRQIPTGECRAAICKPPARLGPQKISIARLPITGSDLFGREEDTVFLDDTWANPDANVVTIVAWAGVGKSTLVNHWLRRMAAQHYPSAELVYGWSFYRQGSSGGTSSADEFLDAALAWFGDSDPLIGTAWEKGERLARLIARYRTLLVLDGLEPLQNPPGPQEGRLREPSLQALLRELAAFNRGLCVITTRLPVTDIADHERLSAPRRELEHLSNDAGARLLRALGVKGHDTELRSASDEFGGHCLALTLLGSYLTDAYDGDVRFRKEVSERLTHDVRQGVHARKVMESYQTWLGEGPELAVLRMLGLFDRPASENVLEVLLQSPSIPGLTESLADLNSSQWRMILARLRRARLLAREDPHNPGYLDMHPLVREYFGEQLRSHQTEAWQECNRRLYIHYRTLAPRLPDNVREMDPLFLAVICGCNAGLFHEALNEVYIPRIQRGSASFAANVLGARGALLSVLVHFFQAGRWGSPVQTGVEGQVLTEADQLFILIQAALNITALRESALEAKICYEHAESLCDSLNRPLVLYVALMGQLRYSVVAGKLSAAMPLARRLYSLAQKQNDPTLLIGASTAVGGAHYYLGDFEAAWQYTTRALEIWRSRSVRSPFQEVDAQPVACLSNKALLEWHFGKITCCHATMAEAIALAKELNDMHGLAVALGYAVKLTYNERGAAKLECLASDLIELATRHSFAHWLAIGEVFRGWARSASGNKEEGLLWIEEGIEDYRTTGSIVWVPLFLMLKAEALDLVGRSSEALRAITEAEALVEKSEARCWSAELYRLRGVFLAKLGADEVRIDTAFHEAIRTAKQQKSISLIKRAKVSYAKYRSQKGERYDHR